MDPDHFSLFFIIPVNNSSLRTEQPVPFEPPCGKTNNAVSEQVRHKPACTVTEKSQKIEIL